MLQFTPMAVETTLGGEIGKGAFWGVLVKTGYALVAAVFGATLAGEIVAFGLGGGAVAATIFGINKLVGAIFPKKAE